MAAGANRTAIGIEISSTFGASCSHRLRPVAVASAPQRTAAHIIHRRRNATPSDRIASALYLNPPAEGSPVPLGAPLEDFGFDTWERKSAVLRFMPALNVTIGEIDHMIAMLSDVLDQVEKQSR